MTPLEYWLGALPLDEAWWLLGAEDEKLQYRNAGGNVHLTKFLEETMHRDVITRIYHGDLLCLGVRTSPAPGDGPEILPQFLFANPEVNWANSTVRAFGRAYEGVRVIAREQVTDIGLPQQAQAKRHGRPPVGEKLREVVRHLQEEGQLDGLSRKQQESVIRVCARERHPTIFPRESQPSRTKILEALKAEGLS